MAAGCPIIATNCEGNKNQVLHGNNGFVCGTLEEMEKHLSYLIDNRDMARRMGRNNIIYSHRFSSENIIKQFVDFISYV
jgi:glycosyltransferase involved in cell wall biosynthesis